jgi:hypothetical protein
MANQTLSLASPLGTSYTNTAEDVISDFNIMTRDYFMPALVNQIWKKNVLLDILVSKQKKIGTGRKIIVDLEYGDSMSGGPYTKTDKLDIVPTESLGEAEFDWAHYWAGNSIWKFDELQNAGKEQRISLVKTKLKAMENKIRRDIAKELFVESHVADHLNSIHEVFLQTGIYGGINRANNAWWKAPVSTTAAALTFEMLEKGLVESALLTGEPADLIVMNKHAFNYYWSLCTTKTVWNDKAKDPGLEAPPFGKARVIWDENVPDDAGAAGANHSNIYFLNTNHIFLYSHPKDSFTFSGWTDMTNIEGQRRLDGRIFWTGNIMSDLPQAHYALIDNSGTHPVADHTG